MKKVPLGVIARGTFFALYPLRNAKLSYGAVPFFR